MSALLYLLAALGLGAISTAILRGAGVPPKTAARAGLGVAAFVTLGLVALWITGLGEYIGENKEPPPPSSWPWSPRREFCDRSSSPAALGAVALTLLPVASILVGTILVDRGRRTAGFAVYLLLVLTPFAPTLYLDALPYYRLDSYPVLDDALLRPATASTAPRVCYVYGIVSGPRKLVVRPDTPRTCLDLQRTPQALSLTTGYDQGRTGFDLEVMGHNLAEKGLPVHPGDTGVNGLAVDRVYKLTDSQAQIGAKRVF